MIENLLVKLVHMCDLGKIIADVESISGGLMHRMYKVITDSGIYAVKHLNPTQTNTWLACKVYLDLGFLPIKENLEHSNEGWKIVKELTSHSALKNI